MTPLDEAAIKKLVAELDPPDWVQMRLTAQISPAQRVLTGMHAQAFAMALLRGAFSERFPELTQSELNMLVLAYLTPVRMKTGTSYRWQELLARAQREAGSTGKE